MKNKHFLFLFLCLLFCSTGWATDIEQTLENNFVEDINPSIYQSKVYQAQVVVSYHNVTGGDNLKKIARLNDISVEDIKRWNDLKSDQLKIGSQLKIQKIEYILIGKPQLKEPELLTIEPVKNTAMEEYVAILNTEVKMEREISDILLEDRMNLIAEATYIDYKSKSLHKKKIWTHITGVATTTFNSVKDWGQSVVEKVSPKNNRILLAQNQPDNIEQTVTAPLDDVMPVEIGTKQIFPQGDNWKKVYHKVRFGETMTQIANRYKVSKDDIVQWNNLPCDIANVKQRLLIFVPKDFALVQHTTISDKY